MILKNILITGASSGIGEALALYYAKQKEKLITNPKHLILKAAHPSPFSAYHGFFDCHHFSKTNEFLIKNNLTPIDWQID